MSDLAPGPRLALAGAGSLLGQEIKRRLAAAGFPSDSVTLLDLEGLAGVLTDYGDEARVIAEAAAAEVLSHDLACFCGSPELAAGRLDELLAAGRLGLDCTGAWNDRPEVFLWMPGITAPPRASERRAIALPRPATTLAGTALAALGELAGSAVASLFVPASELGEAGLHELSQQAVAVLNLDEIDSSLFGRQLAFDLWPATGEGMASVASVAAELGRLDLPVPALSVVAAGVFHGIALSLFVPRCSAATVESAFAAAGIGAAGGPGEPAVDSPVRVAGLAGLHAASVREDAGGAWAWVVIDNLDAQAVAAVAAIHALLGPVGGAPLVS